MQNLEFKPSLNYQSGIHSVEAGLDFKYSDMNNSIDEHNYQVGPDSTLELPYSNNLNQYFTFRSAAGFITDQIKFSKSLILNAGARILKYFFSNETVVSPRFILFYSPSVKHTFNFNYGYYYQPPGVNELRDNPLPEGEKLVSQRAAHYIAGWEYRAKPKVKYQFQFFYKKMDDLIPYNIKNMQIIYIGSNIMKGYAYGFDFQYQGEVVQGLKSWIGYSFLNAKEKPKDGSAGYQRSLNDQTHTIKIFLQDRTRKHPDFQVHTRIIGGSGLLYHPQIREINKTTGKSFLTYDLNQVGVFPFYFRIDMGMTFDFNFKNNSKLTLLAEVLNVLDNKNVADYNWFSILPYSREYTIGVHQLFSRRFFNVGLEYKL
jgi:outer membrane receptor protein involved in Fe transport